MKKIILLAAVLLILLAAGSYEIRAECPDGASFRSGHWAGHDWRWDHIMIRSTRCVDTCTMTTTMWPGHTHTFREICPGADALEESNLEAVFWELGKGDPAPGRGNDSGSLQPTEWMTLHLVPQWTHGWLTDCPSGFDTLQGPGINGGWYVPGVDGCIERSSCMGILFSDRYLGKSYFYFASRRGDSGEHSDPVFQFGPGSLSRLPKPEVQAASPGIAKVIVNVPPLYMSLDQDCDTDVVLGYQLYQQVVPEGSGPPEKHDLEAWTRVDRPLPPGASIPFSLGCGSGEGVVYLAGGIIFEGGFGTAYPSEAVGPYSCKPGPTFRLPSFGMPSD